MKQPSCRLGEHLGTKKSPADSGNVGEYVVAESLLMLSNHVRSSKVTVMEVAK